MTTPWIVAVMSVWVALIALAVVVLGFLRRATAVLERAEAAASGPAEPLIRAARAGTRIGNFEVRDRAGRPVDSERLLSTAAVYLFVWDECAPCKRLAEQLPGAAGETIGDVPLRIVVDSAEATGAFPDELAVLEQRDGSASFAFENGAGPQAFAVDDRGVVVDSLVPSTIDDLSRLAARLRKDGDAIAGRREQAEQVRS